MGIFKSQEILKKIGNNELLISETVIVDNQDHLTNGENFILVKNNGKSNIFLNSKTTEHIIIKSLTDVVVYGDLLIDEDDSILTIPFRSFAAAPQKRKTKTDDDSISRVASPNSFFLNAALPAAGGADDVSLSSSRERLGIFYNRKIL